MEDEHGDPYASEVHTWWHLSTPSPELVSALDDGWLAPPGRVLDVGCGLGTEAAYLASNGFEVVGVDLSDVALLRARRLHPGVSFRNADVRALPFEDASFDAVIDRGMLHYLPPAERTTYGLEVDRVLRSGGRVLLRACCAAHGVRNDITEEVVRALFKGYEVDSLEAASIPSDTRSLPALVCRLRSVQVRSG